MLSHIYLKKETNQNYLWNNLSYKTTSGLYLKGLPNSSLSKIFIENLNIVLNSFRKFQKLSR